MPVRYFRTGDGVEARSVTPAARARVRALPPDGADRLALRFRCARTCTTRKTHTGRSVYTVASGGWCRLMAVRARALVGMCAPR